MCFDNVRIKGTIDNEDQKEESSGVAQEELNGRMDGWMDGLQHRDPSAIGSAARFPLTKCLLTMRVEFDGFA